MVASVAAVRPGRRRLWLETTPQGKPIRLQLRRVKGFRRVEIVTLAKRNLNPASIVVSDGLRCFTGVGKAGCVHQPIITGSGRQGRPDARVQVGVDLTNACVDLGYLGLGRKTSNSFRFSNAFLFSVNLAPALCRDPDRKSPPDLCLHRGGSGKAIASARQVTPND